ncbi:glutathione S-transferase family protein [Achromobacter xylosoxidans]|uniref:glutathione S-transferase family protein n=1 Tax=Alcaligenes xylosoxydans xylosoxydans TaxID=85698 RepID=UPI0003D680EF|nr:glutathione S-transferase family protein [Achromobacter xylosoxidans]AHC47391.1 glutathione S-transferase [Achromobacter xylosoxidans NBRC 15126 = ATCC 27061]QKQ51791.1 glutathione S-transferase family protein [Achromobacter xylosoxidans]QPR93328.1 glutathione S-transferase family protein [Achromobacter xylosoxidans]UON43006.1 glutathione S-transferase family protein [Achromobacter xylosoxidans]CKH46148.1 GST-like protein yfcG [Achromobacter xylosoxidans]
MQIYWIQAQAPRRVLALVKHLGIEAEFIEMDLMAGALQRPEYAAINPNMKVPTLVDGDYHLWESSAIMAYLCVKAGSDMWPADTREQIEVLRWLSWNDCHWAPAVAPYYFEHIVKSTFGIGPPDAGELAGKEKAFDRYAAVLDTHLRDREQVACGRLTIADFQLASMAAYWKAAGMPMAPYPRIVAWLDGLMRLPAWADPWPDGRADPA